MPERLAEYQIIARTLKVLGAEVNLKNAKKEFDNAALSALKRKVLIDEMWDVAVVQGANFSPISAFYVMKEQGYKQVSKNDLTSLPETYCISDHKLRTMTSHSVYNHFIFVPVTHERGENNLVVLHNNGTVLSIRKFASREEMIDRVEAVKTGTLGYREATMCEISALEEKYMIEAGRTQTYGKDNNEMYFLPEDMDQDRDHLLVVRKGDPSFVPQRIETRKDFLERIIKYKS